MIDLAVLLEDPDFIASVYFEVIKYPPHEIVLEENETTQDVYLILNGQVRVNTRVREQNDGIVPGLAQLGKGEFFGELAMFDGEPRSAEVITVTACEIAKIHGPQMLSFMEKYPEKGYLVLRELFMKMVTRMRQNNLRTRTVLEMYLKESSNLPK